MRHIRPVADVLRATGGPLSVGLICTIALLVASAQRARVLEAPGRLGALLVLGLLLYGGLYAMGLAWGARADGRARRAWALASGNSNIVLGLTLALLHLPEHAVTFLAWDLAWILALSAIQPVLRAMVPAGGEPWPGP
ncbi:MAG: hypothetical protein H6734_12480 [Alphaproteobacteria bacterium]|nr:hypothetical protein [Alphaproteobacteria bacterium]